MCVLVCRKYSRRGETLREEPARDERLSVPVAPVNVGHTAAQKGGADTDTNIQNITYMDFELSIS